MIKSSLTFIFFFCFLLSCNPTSESKTEQPKKTSIVDSANLNVSPPDSTVTPNNNVQGNTNNIFNNITAILCGEKGKANNLNYLFDTAAWLSHSKFIDSSWKRLERKRLVSMQKWGRKEFEKPNTTTKMVFYPFSGPDYLTAHAFFPNADKYIMLGLEPVGKLPDLQKFKAGDAKDYSEDFKKSLGDIFDKSYFITRKMLNDFQSQKVNGLLPVLAFFIKKSGNEILDIRYLIKYNQDSIGEVAYDKKMGDYRPFGVRIDFLQEGKQKSVYYFKYDVANKNFNDTTAFYKYLNKNTANCITYIKSASYLLHANFMSNMKALILKNSKAVVQDDTGIPFKYFEAGKKFDVKLYGEYSQPVSDFPYLSLQKPLQEAFHKDSLNVGKLPFHLGYHWGTRKDVIIYAQKK
jgi:hypothetical protein